MKNYFVLVVALSVFVGGCARQPVAITKPCDLSSLKIKRIKLEGDRDGFISAAVAARLFVHGARLTDDGVFITGTVRQSQAGEMSATLISNTAAIAAVAYVSGSKAIVNENYAKTLLAEKLAAQVCECVHIPPHGKPK